MIDVIRTMENTMTMIPNEKMTESCDEPLLTVGGRDEFHNAVNLVRKTSLTDVEAFVLHALLIDEEDFNDKSDRESTADSMKVCYNHRIHDPLKILQADEVDCQCSCQLPSQTRGPLTDDILFAIPHNFSESVRESVSQIPTRQLILGLWRSHQDGVHPRQLIKEAAVSDLARTSLIKKSSSVSNAGSIHSFDSDEEVMDDKKSSDIVEISTQSSSIRDDDHQERYDAWEILRDEYAEDFGFSYSPTKLSDDNDDVYNTFTILGTSADDKSAQPHVLSPPLMDAIMSFLPEQLQSENYWLRYSLVRDGASLDTMKHYINPCKYTLIAIETTNGDVFGSFTSHPWRNQFGFYGHIPAFVWKMRHNRKSKCSSLFEQAQLESMIDVFLCTDRFRRIQVCHHDGIAIGGDELMPNMDDYDDIHEAFAAAERCGFAIGLFDDSLSRGVTAQSSIFKSPSLVGAGNRAEIFDVANLEVWTFTPCFDVASAEKLEMTKYFVEETITRRDSSSTNSSAHGASQELNPELFYRRIGDDPDSEIRREMWQYQNTLHGFGNSSKGLGQSPRFPQQSIT